MMEPKNFEIILEDKTYEVIATPFNFNDETRYKVTYNKSTEYIFTFDKALNQFVGMGDEAIRIPNKLEAAIAAKLLTVHAVSA
jgi:hypothetical protein